MSRSGYTDDDGDDRGFAMWRGQVMSAMRGKRGQQLLRDLRDGLDAMPEKVLIAKELMTSDGNVCALGAVALKRQIPDLPKFIYEKDGEEYGGDYREWNEDLAEIFDIAPCLAREIQYINDEGDGRDETPSERWTQVRAWVDRNIKAEVVTQ